MKYNWDFPWHNDDCDVEFKYSKTGVKNYWCITHNQWVSDKPVKTTTTYEYADGTEVTHVR
jgi:hypothetical protein